MTTDEVRKKYLDFFVKKGHKIIQSSPMVLEGDPTTLFTSSGMQQLVPYLKGEKHPQGKRLVDIQPTIRAQGKNDDFFEVGDSRHLTYFEMLGNWSLGDYFKKEQLTWAYEFYTKELGLPKDKLWVSVFEGLPAQAGNKEVPKDAESIAIWKSLGIPEERIKEYGPKKNWWSRSGTPEEMPAGEIGGPNSEIFYEFEEIKHDKKFGEECHPNCDCGRFLEIGNSVFLQYLKQADGTLKELPQKNVDFGGGLERITAVVNNDSDIFKIDLYQPTISKIEKITDKKYDQEKRAMQIIADHMRFALALIKEGVEPSNKLHGYVLRKFIRRAAMKLRELKPEFTANDFYEISGSHEVENEVAKFLESLKKGLREIERLDSLDGKKAFDLYQSYGFPIELTQEIAEEKGLKLDLDQFKAEFEKHRELSRTASGGMFMGGLADASETVTKLHTATHLLHAALRKILGETVSQKGSNITAERLRFDFSFDRKLTPEELKQVEDLINDQIDKKLEVTMETMSLDEAIKTGALHFFAEKYGEKVKVYTIGSFSKEVCGGPHVTNTSEIGHVRIIKQEKVGASILRIYATNG